MDQQILEALTFYADPKSYASANTGTPDVMRDGGVKAKEALKLAEQGDGPCTGGCLMADCPNGRGCVRCGLEFASEAEWRARAEHDRLERDRQLAALIEGER